MPSKTPLKTSLKKFWLRHTDPARYQDMVDKDLAQALIAHDKDGILTALKDGADPANPEAYYSQVYGAHLTPLDILLDPYGSHRREQELDREDKAALYNEFCKYVFDPAKLLSGKTLELASRYKNNELVLGEILKQGLIDDISKNPELFVKAGGGGLDEYGDKLAVMKIMRPYIRDVNLATPKNNINAGFAACFEQDAESFKWLDEQGLDHNHKARGGVTYAHMIVAEPEGHTNYYPKKRRQRHYKRMALARYLVDNDFPIDDAGQAGKTPTALALRHGYFDVARLYLENGARPDAAYMSHAVQSIAQTHVSSAALVGFLDYAHDTHGLSYDTALTAAITQAAKGHRQAHDIIGELTARGVRPAPSADLDRALTTIWNDAKKDNKSLRLLERTGFLRRSSGYGPDNKGPENKNGNGPDSGGPRP